VKPYFLNWFRICSVWCSHSSGCEELHPLGYNAVYFVESQPTFRRNVLPPFSGSNIKPSNKSAWKQVASVADFFLGLFFESEDGIDMFFRNVDWLSTDYTALYVWRWNTWVRIGLVVTSCEYDTETSCWMSGNNLFSNSVTISCSRVIMTCGVANS
jgi:hypothetical protein